MSLGKHSVGSFLNVNSIGKYVTYLSVHTIDHDATFVTVTSIHCQFFSYLYLPKSRTSGPIKTMKAKIILCLDDQFDQGMHCLFLVIVYFFVIPTFINVCSVIKASISNLEL